MSENLKLPLRDGSNLKLGCVQIASSDGGSEGRDSDIWTEYGGEVGFSFIICVSSSFVFLFGHGVWWGGEIFVFHL